MTNLPPPADWKPHKQAKGCHRHLAASDVAAIAAFAATHSIHSTASHFAISWDTAAKCAGMAGITIHDRRTGKILAARSYRTGLALHAKAQRNITNAIQPHQEAHCFALQFLTTTGWKTDRVFQTEGLAIAHFSAVGKANVWTGHVRIKHRNRTVKSTLHPTTTAQPPAAMTKALADDAVCPVVLKNTPS